DAPPEARGEGHLGEDLVNSRERRVAGDVESVRPEDRLLAPSLRGERESEPLGRSVGRVTAENEPAEAGLVAVGGLLPRVADVKPGGELRGNLAAEPDRDVVRGEVAIIRLGEVADAVAVVEKDIAFGCELPEQ